MNNSSRHPLYWTWAGMRSRCKYPRYTHYHGRGIKVCERWIKSFDNFIADMGSKPTPNHTLDRINNNGNYEPSNCRWATRQEQVDNRSIPKWNYVTCSKIGMAMRDHRKSSGVSLRKVAEKMGISAPYLSDLERGNRNWSSKDINAFNSAVDCLS